MLVSYHIDGFDYHADDVVELCKVISNPPIFTYADIACCEEEVSVIYLTRTLY